MTPSKTKTAKPAFGTPARIAACKRHRPAMGIDLATGKANGRIGCWFCGADLAPEPG